MAQAHTKAGVDHSIPSGPAKVPPEAATSTPTQASPQVVSTDKVADLDFSLARNEIQTRMGYNRQVQSVQFTAFTALLLSTQFAGHVKLFCLVALTLNLIFLHEISKNAIYIRLAALYITKVVNVRFGKPISEWESFLSIMRKHRSLRHERVIMFFGNTAMAPGIFAVAFLAIYIRDVFVTPSSVIRSRSGLLALIVPLVLLNVLAFWVHLRNRQALAILLSQPEAADFAARYKLL